VSVGAVDAANPRNGFAEPYSARGPTNDGRVKPDIVAPDDVAVSGAAGFPTPFLGTSAAAPHIAGMAALPVDAVGNHPDKCSIDQEGRRREKEAAWTGGPGE